VPIFTLNRKHLFHFAQLFSLRKSFPTRHSAMALLHSLPPTRPCRSRFERLHRSIWRTKYVPYTSSRLACTSRGSDVERGERSFPTPLKERDASFTSSSVLVSEWRAWARDRAKATSEGLPATSELPSIESLFTEIDWIVEDAVAGPESCAEEIVNAENANDAENAKNKPNVLLRESVDDLRNLWNERLESRVPLQYLTATSHWRDLVLVVTPAVLIPRPETELMVDFVIREIRETPAVARKPWVDLGTGSGALSISIARELRREIMRASSELKAVSVPGESKDDVLKNTETPTSSNTPLMRAVDLSPDAAAVARHNVKRCGLSEHVSVHVGSWYEPLVRDNCINDAGAAYRGTFGGIVSNPPYIPSRDISGLQPEVFLHEPRMALDGGEGKGMDALVSVYVGAARHLVTGGYLLVETNGGAQAVELADDLRAFRLGSSLEDDQRERTKNKNDDVIFEDVRILDDYRGVGRFVSARRATRNEK